MATPIAELFISVSADVSNAVLGLTALSSQMNKLNSEFGSAVPAAEALVGIGAGLGLGLAAAAGSAANFQSQLTQVRNNTTLTDEGMQAMRDTVQRLGAEAPVSLENLTTGFMHVSNFGFDAAQSTQILEAAMRSAVSTGGNTAATAEVLAAVLHEFGLSGNDAAKTMDELHIASAEGNLTLEQFSNSFGQVAAFAAAVGVPLDQAAAAMAAMTRHGFDAATASTQVKDQIVHLINPSQAAKKELEDLSQRSGVDLVNAFSATGLHALGLTGVLDLATGAMNKLGLTQDQQTSTWLKLVPNIRGGAASFVLAGRGAEDFRSILEDMHNSLGITDEAFTRIQATAAFQWGTLGNQFQLLAIAIGDVLLPRLTQLAQFLSGIVQWFRNLDPSVQESIVNIAGIASIVLVALGAFALLGPVIAAVGPALASLGAALAPIVVVMGAAALIWKTFEAAVANNVGGLSRAGPVLENLGAILQTAFAGHIGEALDGLISQIDAIIPGFRDFTNQVAKTFGDLVSQVQQIFGVLRAIFYDVLQGDFGSALDLAQGLVGRFSPELSGLIGNIRDFGTAVGTDLSNALDSFGKQMQPLIASMQPVVAFLDEQLLPRLANPGATIDAFAAAVERLRAATAQGTVAGGDQFAAGLVAFFDTLTGPFKDQVASLGPLAGSIANFAGSLNQLALAIGNLLLIKIPVGLVQGIFGLIGDVIAGLPPDA
ncbi:MAG TPA: phage tail tape measure protein, partial [Chloroflexota bacterium]|nr:phage tail tape measure protein [Chloroflexota bacterium]